MGRMGWWHTLCAEQRLLVLSFVLSIVVLDGRICFSPLPSDMSMSWSPLRVTVCLLWGLFDTAFPCDVHVSLGVYWAFCVQPRRGHGRHRWRQKQQTRGCHKWVHTLSAFSAAAAHGFNPTESPDCSQTPNSQRDICARHTAADGKKRRKGKLGLV